MKKRLSRWLPATGWLLLGGLLGVGVVLAVRQAFGLTSRPPLSRPLVIESSSAEVGLESGPYGPFKVRFNQPLDASSLAGRLAIDQIAVESYSIEGGRLSIRSEAPLRPGVHQLTMGAGVAAETGAGLRNDLSLRFQVRRPAVLFLQVDTSKPALARLDRGEIIVLSGAHSVLDFAPAPDGASVVYAATNDRAGADLWQVDRQGRQREILLDCGADRCHQAAWAPDGERIAFVREEHVAGEVSAPPRLWTLDLAGGQAAPLYQDRERTGRNPRWSPDGRWLAYYDPVSQAIALLDTDTVSEQVFLSRAGLAVEWSPEGTALLAPVLELVEEQPRLSLHRIMPGSQTSSQLLGSQGGWLEVGVPAWSPVGDRIALSARRRNGSQAHGIWLIDPAGEDLGTVAADPAYAYGGPDWDPWGEQLLFQRFALRQQNARPELMIWHSEGGSAEVLVVGAAAGRWLP